MAAAQATGLAPSRERREVARTQGRADLLGAGPATSLVLVVHRMCSRIDLHREPIFRARSGRNRDAD